MDSLCPNPPPPTGAKGIHLGKYFPPGSPQKNNSLPPWPICLGTAFGSAQADWSGGQGIIFSGVIQGGKTMPWRVIFKMYYNTQIITRTYFPGGWIKPFPRWMEKWNKFPRWMDKWWKFPRWMVYWFKIKLAPWPSMLYQPISMTFYAISINISDLLCWIN